MSDIFLSYASADRDRAKSIAGVLEGQGWSVWWDRTIPPGSTFDKVIEQALDSARCVVVLWSKTSAASDWVKTEAAEGARRKILVPALIDDVKIPLEFRRVQAANLSDWRGGTDHPELATLFRSIADRLVAAPAGTPADRPPRDGSRQETSELPDSERQSDQSGLHRSRDASPQKLGIGLLVAVVALVVVAAAGIGGGWLLWRPSITVPDVGGLPAEKAKAILKDVGLDVGRANNKETADAVPGTVLSQSPAAREKARKGQSIDLVVATAALIPVPNVQGRTLEQARSALEKAGLAAGGMTSKVTDEASPGTVLAQRPEAGARAEKMATVDLVIAARVTVEVPDVVGESFERARTLLTQAGFAVGRRESQQTEEATPGVVLSQKPAARTRVPQGQEISLVLAVRPSLRVPDLVGLALRDAQARLERAGLVTGGVDNAPSGDRPAGTVLRQRPIAGEQTEKGRAVDLVVAIATPVVAPPELSPRPPIRATPRPPSSGGPVLVPDVARTTSREAASALERIGLLPLIRESDVAQGPAGTVVTQRPVAGTPLEQGKGVVLIVRAAPPTPDTAGNNISGLIWKYSAETETELHFRVTYTYKGDKGESGVVIYAYPLTADDRGLAGLERIEQPVTVGTAAADLKLVRKPGGASVTTNRLRVCMVNKERRVPVFCRTYAFGKVWG
jgi:beta-lactam-binding protein with PASTA domain